MLVIGKMTKKVDIRVVWVFGIAYIIEVHRIKVKEKVEKNLSRWA